MADRAARGEAARSRETDADRHRELTDRARERHDALSAAIERLERAAALAGRLPGSDDLDFPALRREAAGLLAELRAHRATEADLIYESFWTDLGAGD